jgi:hypothetical protein
MSGPCPVAFDRMAQDLGGFGCATASPVVNLRAPWELTNWTLALLEVGMVLAAGYALFHAIGRWRRHDDPTVIALWASSVVYLLLIEPTVYFPEQLGVPGQHEVVFVHNVFAVQFMYDRLPLYIVALYPAMITLSYELVRSLGIFARRGTLVGAVCVGAVHHCFYEVFDHVGPQLRWWAWAPEAKTNHLMVASVPLTSIILFAALGPIFLVLLVRWLLPDRGPEHRLFSTTAVVGRTLAAGALMLPVLALLGAPWTMFVAAASPSAAAPIATCFLAAVLAIVAAMVIGSWRSEAPDEPGARATARYVEIHGWAWLATFALFWVVALPDLIGAADGITADGTPIGSPTYWVLSYSACAALLVTVGVRDRHRTAHAVTRPPSPSQPIGV